MFAATSAEPFADVPLLCCAPCLQEIASRADLGTFLPHVMNTLEVFRGGMMNEVKSGVQRMEPEIFDRVDSRMSWGLGSVEAKVMEKVAALEGKMEQLAALDGKMEQLAALEARVEKLAELEGKVAQVAAKLDAALQGGAQE